MALAQLVFAVRFASSPDDGTARALRRVSPVYLPLLLLPVLAVRW